MLYSRIGTQVQNIAPLPWDEAVPQVRMSTRLARNFIMVVRKLYWPRVYRSQSLMMHRKGGQFKPGFSNHHWLDILTILNTPTNISENLRKIEIQLLVGCCVSTKQFALGSEACCRSLWRNYGFRSRKVVLLLEQPQACCASGQTSVRSA